MSAQSTTLLPGERPTKRVDFGGDTIQTLSRDEEEPNGRRWISSSSRNQTNLAEVVVDTRSRAHANIFRRPRALLYKPIDDEKASPAVSRTSSNTSSKKDDSEERSTGNIPKQLKRLDLFVDVLWVGIIANLSGTFGDQAFTDSGVETSSAIIE